MKECIRACLLTTTLLVMTHSVRAQTGQYPHRFETVVSKKVSGKYLLFLPKDYGKGPNRYPLIMYLHGGSLRGEDLEKVRALGLPRIVEEDKSFPFIVVSPLCPAGEIWTDTDMLIGILDEVSSKYSVDPERIYLTGHSMGGRGALYFGYKHPERFAAIISISGNVPITAWVSRLKDVPVWLFHGVKDDLVPIKDSETMVEALKTAGGDVKFTRLPERDHFILDIYENKELYQWLLDHRKNMARK